MKPKAIFLDMDGTLLSGDHWIAGAKETLAWLLHQDFKVRILTNTTLKTRSMIAGQLSDKNMTINPDWVYTPLSICGLHMKTLPLTHGVLPLLHPQALTELAGVKLTSQEPADWVLVGDMGEHWRAAPLDTALRCLKQGAKLCALHMGHFWLSNHGLAVDVGAYATALEYAAETRCETIYGKPNPLFFQTALQDSGVNAAETIMVGDSLNDDVIASQALGITGVLVKTGPRSQHYNDAQTKPANVVLTSFADLPKHLEAV